MALVPGVRLGHYEVVAPLGAGGMGEVYRARDTRLGRDVAVKLLPPRVAHDAERRARFEREAKTISSLNHPHICTLFDVGEAAGSHFLVMELLEGESLAERLQRGALPLEQVVKYGAQIAGALDCAHRQGIVHRDLKPGNVVLTKTGAKLLDFGLARSSGEGSLAAGPEEEATEAKPLTAAGTVLGTYQYMAPEQLAGAEATSRTDIFALGAVLYEMATGKRAFEGKSKTSLVAAILSTQPQPISAVGVVVPPALEHVVRKCLEKEPDDRWQSAHDVASELRWIGEAGSGAGAPGVVMPVGPLRGRWLRKTALVVAGTTLLALGWTSALVLRPASRAAETARPVARLTLQLPPDAPLALVDAIDASFAISPDGSTIAYVAQEDGGRNIRVRTLARDHARAVPGTEGGNNPFFSPDGAELAFFSAAGLKRVSLKDDRVTAICEEPLDPLYGSGDWGPDGTIVFRAHDGIRRVSAGGGQASRLIASRDPARTEDLRMPSFLPGGRWVVVNIDVGGARSGSAAVLSLETGERRLVADGVSSCQYATSGHLVCVKAGRLTAIPFDPVRGETTGPGVGLDESVLSPYGRAEYSLSASGTILYRRRPSARALVWVERDGRESGVLASGRVFQHPRLAPDGRQIAVEEDTGARSQIWIVDAGRGAVTLLTTDGDGRFPIWTPDGRHVTFSTQREGGRRIYWQRPDGGSAAEKIDPVPDPSHDTDGSWSPDGKVLAHTAIADGLWRTSLLRPGGGQPLRFLQTAATNWEPRFSPDGRWIAYTSDESGRYEVYVRAYPDAGHRVQVSVGGGHDAVWARDGRELFYRRSGRLYAVPVLRGERFSFGEPRPLFDGPYMDMDGAANYDVTLDGRRFLMVKVSEEELRPTRLEVVLNWFEELRAR